MNKEELKKIHYTHKNEIQFEYGGQVHHYNMDNLKEVIITAWESQERINEAVEILGEYKHYSTPTEEQNRENEDVVDKAYEILKGGSNEKDPFLDIEIDEEDLPF